VILDAAPMTPEVAYGVEMAMLCRTYQVLPRTGGLMDQPWIVVEVLKMVTVAQNQKEARDNKKNKK
jgi:hypothetical protein